MKRIRKRLHPIGRAIENILAAGHTPRLQIDARRKDVTVPEHVRARWGARLIIDVDPSWPLAMEHTKEALELDLAFQGVVERCVLGWGSIYAIVDRSSGQGTVFRENLPHETLAPEFAADTGEVASPEPPARTGRAADQKMSSGAAPLRRVLLTAVRTPADTRETPVPAASVADPSSAPATSASDVTAASSASSASSASDEAARARRARFRVIAGGG